MNVVWCSGTTYPFVVCWLILATCVTSCTPQMEKSEIRAQFQQIMNEADSIAFKGQYRNGMAYLDSAVANLQPLSVAEKISKYQFHYIYYKEIERNFEQANRYTDSVITLFDDGAYRREHLSEYRLWVLNKGDVLIDLNQFNEAFRYYYIGKSIIENEGDSCSRAHFSTRLGLVRYRQMNYRDAVHYFKQSFAEHQLCVEQRSGNYYEAVHEVQGVLNNIGWFYELLNQPDSALFYYHKALHFLGNNANSYPGNVRDIEMATAVIYGNVGGLYSKIGRLDSAAVLLQKSIEINSRPGYDQRDLQSAQIKLAELYVKQGRLPEAEMQLKNTQSGLDSLPNKEYDLRLMKVRSLYHSKAGNAGQAYDLLQAHHHLKDSASFLNQHVLGTDFVKEFESIEQHLNLERLRGEHKQRAVFLAISGIALLLISCVVYLVYRNWQSSKRNVEHLKALNDRIQEKNEKLQLALLALQDSQQENTRILTMIAHDLRTPVANIKLGVDMLLSQHTAGELQHEFLDVIGKSSNHLLEMVEELMYTHEKDTTREKEPINLEAMVSDCVDLMRFKANEKVQTISSDTVPVIFSGSREKIWRVISNLIGNAIKFTPEHGHIQVRLRQQDNEALISVRDEGIGIPEEYRDSLFEMSHIYGREGTNGEPSTGLGLAIVKQIVSSYEGKIYFSSSPNNGTTFHVHLPI